MNDKGEVLGINTLKMSDAEGIGLAIPISTVVEYLETGEIPVDSNGNVEGILYEPSTPAPADQPKNEEKTESPGRSRAEVPLAIGLTLSVLLNIVLIVILLKKRKLKNTPKGDPSERTDFEIEIYN